MSFVEWIGFVASLIGVVYLFTKDALAKREKAKDPVKYAEKERRMKEVLRQMGVDVPDERDQEEEQQEDEDEEEEYEVKKPEVIVPLLTSLKSRAASFPTTHIATIPGKIAVTESRVARMVNKLPDRRDILVSHILFGPPKSLE